MPTPREIAEIIKSELDQGGELTQALGVEEAAHVRDEISDVLAQPDGGVKVEDQLIAVLAAREPTRARLDALLPDSLLSGERGLVPLPGYSPYPPDIEIYRCPLGDYEWPRFDLGETVPNCPAHDVPLVRSDC
jgi:aspartate/methionine/tyrosine aminotransferase